MEPYNEEKYRKFLTGYRGKYETFLWSGWGEYGEEWAKAICNAYNNSREPDELPWKTNEMLLEEAGFEMPRQQRGDSKERKVFIDSTWDSASMVTCEHAKGTAHFLKGENGRLNSTFNKVERKTIANNPDVKKVNIIKSTQVHAENWTSVLELSYYAYEKTNFPITSPSQVKYERFIKLGTGPPQLPPNIPLHGDSQIANSENPSEIMHGFFQHEYTVQLEQSGELNILGKPKISSILGDIQIGLTLKEAPEQGLNILGKPKLKLIDRHHMKTMRMGE